jgi:UDP-N-acetylmuramyl pentapeptide synthase
MVYPIQYIAQLIDAELVGSGEGGVKWLLTDSRSLGFPEETLFFAIVTGRGDGHRYVAELYSRGVRHFVVSTYPTDEWRREMAEASFLVVPDTLAALQLLECSIGREGVLDFIKNLCNGKLPEMDDYPRDKAWLLNFRKELNCKLAEA